MQAGGRRYLISVALRIWKNRRRKFAWRQRIAGNCKFTGEQIGGGISEQAGSAEAEVLQQELQEQVRNAVKNLNEKYRIPVYLYYTLQLSVEEIANTMEIPQGTVKNRLHKARVLLKKELEVVLDETSEWKLADFNEKTTLVNEMQLSTDETGNFNYDYTIEKDGMSSAGTVKKEIITDRDKEGLLKARAVFGDETAAYIETYTLNKNGTLTLRTYQYH